MIEIRRYMDELGRNGFERWFDRLDAGVQARVTAYLDRLERGNYSAAKGVAGIFELRLDLGPGYRVYFGKDGETLVILLAGGRKKTAGRHCSRSGSVAGIQTAQEGEVDGVDEELQRDCKGAASEEREVSARTAA